jgi:hypothetical protein
MEQLRLTPGYGNIRSCDFSGPCLRSFPQSPRPRQHPPSLSAAAELPHVGLVDALELLLLLARDGDQRRFRAACTRWTARYCSQAYVDPAEAQAVLGLLVMLGSDRKAQAAAALAELLVNLDGS